MRATEGFYQANPPEPAFEPNKTMSRPCTVYFTNKVTQCDRGDFAQSKVALAYEIKRLMIRKRLLLASRAERRRLYILKKKLAEYGGMPAGQCKVTIPNWQQLYKATETPANFGKLKQNRGRGPPDQWAFCFRPDGPTRNAWLTSTPFQIAKEKDGTTPVLFDMGTSAANAHIRGTFKSFDKDYVANILCTETRPVDDPVPDSLAFEVVTEKVFGTTSLRLSHAFLDGQRVDVKRLADGDPRLTRLARYFTGAGREVARVSGARQTVHWRPRFTTFPATIVKKSMCNTVVVEDAVGAQIRLKVALGKTLRAVNLATSRLFAGTKSTLIKRFRGIRKHTAVLRLQRLKLFQNMATQNAMVHSINHEINRLYLAYNVPRPADVIANLNQQFGSLRKKVRAARPHFNIKKAKRKFKKGFQSVKSGAKRVKRRLERFVGGVQAEDAVVVEGFRRRISLPRIRIPPPRKVGRAIANLFRKRPRGPSAAQIAAARAAAEAAARRAAELVRFQASLTTEKVKRMSIMAQRAALQERLNAYKNAIRSKRTDMLRIRQVLAHSAQVLRSHVSVAIARGMLQVGGSIQPSLISYDQCVYVRLASLV